MTAARAAMHQAPMVYWRVRRSPLHACALLLAWLAGAAAHAIWWLQAGQAATTDHAWGLAVLFGSGIAALAGWILALPGSLHWTGKLWVWSGDGRAAIGGNLVSVVDLQNLMVLRFDGATQEVRWLWVGDAGGGAQWRAFRRAVFSGRDAVASGETPASGRQAVGSSLR